MSVTERVAYLKGLADGLGLDADTKEGKLISAIIDTLEDIALEIEELNENALDIGEELDAISDDLAEVEELLFDDDDDDDEGDECSCGCCGGDDDDAFGYEVKCPSCGADIALVEADLVNGSVSCAACGEKLEFEFDEDDENDEDDE